jgi:hypothetical protein
VAYKYGVSGPFWYASGATIQVLLFAVLAVEIKRKAPTAHTILEIVKQRWGTAAHLVFLVFCLLTNIIVTSMLILGGAAVVNALTGGAPRRARGWGARAWRRAAPLAHERPASPGPRSLTRPTTPLGRPPRTPPLPQLTSMPVRSLSPWA